MKPKGSLPHSQMPATCPCPEPHQSSRALTSHFLMIILILSSHLHLSLPSLSHRFPHSNPVSTSTLLQACYIPRPSQSSLLMWSSSSSSSLTCQTAGPKPLPKRFLHIVQSRASSFHWKYPLLSLRSSNSFLCLLPRLLVTSICPFIFPSITCCRRQFLRKMWPIQLVFHFLISCKIFLCSLTLK